MTQWSGTIRQSTISPNNGSDTLCPSARCHPPLDGGGNTSALPVRPSGLSADGRVTAVHAVRDRCANPSPADATGELSRSEGDKRHSPAITNFESNVLITRKWEGHGRCRRPDHCQSGIIVAHPLKLRQTELSDPHAILSPRWRRRRARLHGALWRRRAGRPGLARRLSPRHAADQHRRLARDGRCSSACSAKFTPSWQAEARLFLAVGVLGGFTTFSSLLARHASP